MVAEPRLELGISAKETDVMPFHYPAMCNLWRITRLRNLFKRTPNENRKEVVIKAFTLPIY